MKSIFDEPKRSEFLNRLRVSSFKNYSPLTENFRAVFNAEKFDDDIIIKMLIELQELIKEKPTEMKEILGINYEFMYTYLHSQKVVACVLAGLLGSAFKTGVFGLAMLRNTATQKDTQSSQATIVTKEIVKAKADRVNKNKNEFQCILEKIFYEAGQGKYNTEYMCSSDLEADATQDKLKSRGFATGRSASGELLIQWL